MVLKQKGPGENLITTNLVAFRREQVGKLGDLSLAGHSINTVILDQKGHSIPSSKAFFCIDISRCHF